MYIATSIRIKFCEWSWFKNYHSLSRGDLLFVLCLYIYMYYIFVRHILSKEQLILFSLVSFLRHVGHAWPSTFSLEMTMSIFHFFSSFANWINASVPNNAMGWMLKLFNLMPCDNFLSGNLKNRVLATFLWSWGFSLHIW